MSPTRAEFAEGYAKASGCQDARSLYYRTELFAIPCDCGDSMCAGWQMTSLRRAPTELMDAEQRIAATLAYLDFEPEGTDYYLEGTVRISAIRALLTGDSCP